MLKNKDLTKIILTLLVLLLGIEILLLMSLASSKILLNGAYSELAYNFLKWFKNYSAKVDAFYRLFFFSFLISYLIWVYKAHFNLSLLGAKNLRYSHASAVWWWFVPIANLWKPYSVLKEIITQSQKLAFGSIQDNKFAILLIIWWVLHIPSLFFNIVNTMGDPSTLSGYQLLLNMALLQSALVILISVINFYLIYNVDKWQRKANQSKPISLQKS
ncbi:DUF4328 domain-containing protein [Avibacterium paragallinarum]|uniref:DUF4328 domain-containing protein n=1 Tax=Avibacterium paragallinarum TaxID=728 RepID=UPI002EDBA672